MPRLCVPASTSAVPSLLSVTRAFAGQRQCVKIAPAIPWPISQRPSRIEPGSGVRLSQPKRAAPSVRHWRIARVEKGRPLNGSISVSLTRRSATGSTPVV